MKNSSRLNSIAAIKSFVATYGRIPRRSEIMLRKGFPIGTRLLEGEFGSFNKAVIAAGFKPRKSSPQKPIKLICSFCKKPFEHSPNYRAMHCSKKCMSNAMKQKWQEGKTYSRFKQCNLHSFDWNVIQAAYTEDDLTWRELISKFSIPQNMLAKASKSGLFTSRSRSEAVKLARKKCPSSFVQSPSCRERISKSLIAFLERNPDKVPYKRNHSSKPSYPETYFGKIFTKHKTPLSRYFRVGSYELDFAYPPTKLAVEIDGDQHILDPRIVAHDIKRDAKLKALGWRTIRILWSKYSKLSLKQRNVFVAGFLSRLSQEF